MQKQPLKQVSAYVPAIQNVNMLRTGKAIRAIAGQIGALPFSRNTVQIVLELKKRSVTSSCRVWSFGFLRLG